jgi:hypothetical protein
MGLIGFTVLLAGYVLASTNQQDAQFEIGMA